MPKKRLPSNNAKHERIADKVVEKIESFEHQFKDKMVVLIVSAFGLVAALTWNDMIREIFAHFVPQDQVIEWKIFTTVMITIVAVITTMALSRMRPKKE